MGARRRCQEKRIGWAAESTRCYEGEYGGIETKQALDEHKVLTRLILESDTSQHADSREDQKPGRRAGRERTVYVE